MHQIQQNITRHNIEKWGNTVHSQEQNKSLETDPKETEAWNLCDKPFKTTVLNMIKENIGRQLNEIRWTIGTNENINKEIEIIKKEPNQNSGG